MVLLITVPMKEELPVHQQRFASWTRNININKEIFLKLFDITDFCSTEIFSTTSQLYF